MNLELAPQTIEKIPVRGPSLACLATPSEAVRKQPRLDLYVESDCTADFLTENQRIARGCQVLDLSSTGLAVVCLSPANCPKLHDKIQVVIYLKGHKSYFLHCRVQGMQPYVKGGVRLGLAICKKAPYGPLQSVGPLPIEPERKLQGVIVAGGLRQNQTKAVFQVLKLRRDCMRIRIFDQSRVCLPGMKLKIQLMILGPYSRIAKVYALGAVTTGYQDLDIVLAPGPEKQDSNLAYFLQNMAGLSPSQVASLRLPPVAMSPLSFRFVKCQADYQRVLQLRLTAYREAGKVKAGVPPQAMALPTDHRSRILMAFHDKRLVASVSLTFPDAQTRLDTETPLASGYPSFFPDKIEMVEIARLCRHPHYKGSGVFCQMVQKITEITQGSQRRYIITSAEGKLLQLYLQMGFQDSQVTYDHPCLAGIKHHIILTDVAQTCSGRGVSYGIWSKYYRESSPFWVKQGWHHLLAGLGRMKRFVFDKTLRG